MVSRDNSSPKVVVRKVSGDDVISTVREVFAACGGANLIRGDKTFVKVNGIDYRPFCHTDPAVLDATLSVLKDFGAKDISVMENCTQGNITRLVFHETGYKTVCRRHGAKPLYLDEGKRTTIKLEKMGYEVGINKKLESIIHEPDSVTYINVPKLKTHSMSVLTLGIKNQFGLIDQKDRIRDHNYKLHEKFVDIFRLFKPTLTLIDALYAVFYGHYPAIAHLEQCTEKLDMIIGGTDMLAVDTVGARVLGYDISEVPHLKLSREAALGCGDFEKIEIDGALPSPEKKYAYDILMEFPADVKIIRGTERCCREGCRKNTETLLQTLYLDHNGKGGFTILMGKGFDSDEISRLDGPVHIAGTCAIEETLELLKCRETKCRITSSYGCNNLAASIEGVAKHMGIRLYSMPPHPLDAIFLILNAKIRGSRARIPRIF